MIRKAILLIEIQVNLPNLMGCPAGEFDQFDGLPCRCKQVEVIAGELGHLKWTKVKLDLTNQCFHHNYKMYN